jgi:hypothetical protein
LDLLHQTLFVPLNLLFLSLQTLWDLWCQILSFLLDLLNPTLWVPLLLWHPTLLDPLNLWGLLHPTLSFPLLLWHRLNLLFLYNLLFL